MKKMNCLILIIILFGCSDTNLPVEEIEQVYQIESVNNYYDDLNSKEKQVYEMLYECLATVSQELKGIPSDADTLISVYKKLMNDHPEIFYVDNFSYISHENSVDFIPHYNRDEAEIEAMNIQIQNKVDSIISEVDSNFTQLQKIRYLYDYVVEHASYKEDALDNQNIVSALIHGESVCAGYSKTLQLLLEEIDVPTKYITGTANNGFKKENHAWLLINIDGSDYYLDPTWSDFHEPFDHSSSAYFLMNHDEMSDIYNQDDEGTQLFKQTYENLSTPYYIDKKEEQLVKDMLLAQIDEHCIELKFDASVYDYYKKLLIEDEKIFMFLKEVGIDVEHIDVASFDELHFIGIHL